jgi:hypothetical protein
MAVIRVPRTPRRAFNKKRRASELLLRQIDHLEWAVLPASQRKPAQLPKLKVKTEGQAADRIAVLTRQLLEAKASGAPLVVVDPQEPPRKRGRRRRRVTRKRRPRPTRRTRSRTRRTRRARHR